MLDCFVVVVVVLSLLCCFCGGFCLFCFVRLLWLMICDIS